MLNSSAMDIFLPFHNLMAYLFNSYDMCCLTLHIPSEISIQIFHLLFSMIENLKKV